MDIVTEVKGLIGDLKQEIATKDGAIKELETKLDKVADKVEEIASQEKSIGFDDTGKAKEFLGWVSDLAQGKTLTTAIPADGGYTVPTEFSSELIRLIDENGYIRRYATIIPMKGKSMTMPSLATGVTTVWVDEANAIGESQPTFSQVTLTNKKLATLVPISSELLADSSVAMANLIVNLIAEDMAAEEDRVGFAGNTGSGDPYDGILNLSGATSVVMSAGDTAFTNINADYLLNMTDAVPRAARRGAMFFMSREVLNVARQLKSSTGEYIFQNPANSGGFATIWGYPVVDLDVMPGLSASAVSTPFVIFGNPKYMYMGDRESITFNRSIHYAFNLDVTYIRATERVGFVAALPQAFSILTTAAA